MRICAKQELDAPLWLQLQADWLLYEKMQLQRRSRTFLTPRRRTTERAGETVSALPWLLPSRRVMTEAAQVVPASLASLDSFSVTIARTSLPMPPLSMRLWEQANALEQRRVTRLESCAWLLHRTAAVMPMRSSQVPNHPAVQTGCRGSRGRSELSWRCRMRAWRIHRRARVDRKRRRQRMTPQKMRSKVPSEPQEQTPLRMTRCLVAC